MPRPRFARLEPERRRRLLEAAAEEFAANGYQRASLNRVIERAGISKGAFYYYFDDKADLFATVTEQAWATLIPAEPVDLPRLTADSFWPTLEAAFEEMVARAADIPWMVGIARLLYEPPPEGAAAVAAQFERAHEWAARLVARGRELGVVRADLPNDLLVQVVVAAAEAADRWMVDHWDRLDPAELEPLQRRLFALMRRMAEPVEQGA